MKALTYVTILLLALAACNTSKPVLQNMDWNDAGSGSGSGIGSGGSCPVPPWIFPNPTGTEPGWVTNSCPSGGCPSGTMCLAADIAAGVAELGCAPIPESCGGVPSCSCMGCVCGGTADECQENMTPFPNAPIFCATATASSRTVKADIAYVGADERAALAQQALAIPLARYRYKKEPHDARRRLGFIIEDQPDPSPAVLADRQHVDEYGYTSLLLATVQEQAQQIAELRARLDRLEHGEHGGRRSVAAAR